jgi:hypothetical protein
LLAATILQLGEAFLEKSGAVEGVGYGALIWFGVPGLPHSHVSAEQRNKRGSAPLEVLCVPVILIFRYDAGRFLP